MKYVVGTLERLKVIRDCDAKVNGLPQGLTLWYDNIIKRNGTYYYPINERILDVCFNLQTIELESNVSDEVIE